ncbi:MAG: hypothetical protein ACREU3_04685, partial [Steroidobacteraceae bacterium]
YLAGRRFLARPWNLAFTAAVALLPAFIADAQTARMYVFMVTSIAAFVALVFAWERTSRLGYLVAAIVVLVLGIQFYQLAIFATFLVLYPGLVRGEPRKLLLGALAFAAILVGFFALSDWIAHSYPATPAPTDVAHAIRGALERAAAPRFSIPAFSLGAAIAALIAIWVARATHLPGKARAVPVCAGVLLAGGLIAALAAFDHVAALALAAGVVLAARSGPLALRRALLAVLLGLALLALQLSQLLTAGIGLRQAAGALTGWPSVWPYLAVGRYSPFAGALAAAAVVIACVDLARRRRIPGFLLFLALGVWIPLLMIGVFKWSVPIRYTSAESFPLLLGAFAAAQWLWRRAATGVDAWRAARAWKTPLAAAIVCLLVANPGSLARTVYGGYSDHPDHQGAARFMRSQHLGPRDIVVAEDAIEQTYYLGHVDYWLEGRTMASQFVHEVHGRLADIYTGAPLIGTGAALARLIHDPGRGTLYIIGSGEQQQDGRRAARGPGIEHILEALSRRVVFVGRDGLTKVWRIPSPTLAPARRRAPPPLTARAARHG